jgi:hypothetical protein
MKHFLISAVTALALAAPAAAMDVRLGGNWNGKSVPNGQQCRLFNGNGSTPPMTVSGIPAGTAWIVMEFNDKSYQPLSRNGGHGILAYPAKGATTSVPALPGMTNRLPGGAVVMKKARSTGKYASPGYLPPCSGGKGNQYTVDVKAVDAGGKVLARKTNISIGRY